LPSRYREPLTAEDKAILSSPLSDVLIKIKSRTWHPAEVLLAYSKKALLAHEATNCITELMIKDAENWAQSCPIDGPLAGIPVSLKDSCSVSGYDSSIGFSRNSFKPMTAHAPLVQLLIDAGAIPFVKTAIPITLMCEH
jgi:Asp-tRNA(Asn)/Glu-tRNA(Gln) amidotransferase A subunit family amidase